MKNIVKNAKAKFPTMVKAFPKKVTVVKNDINGRLMARLPIVISNGGGGYHHAYYEYIPKAQG